jgi:8-oxo-dGTP diphosphatase
MIVNYCLRCGSALEDRPILDKVRRACPKCGYIHFDDPKVAAIAFIVNENRVLLVKRAGDPEKGKWVLPGGFVDANEDPRAAAIRETLEETGLHIEITGLVDVFFHPASDGSVTPIVIALSGRVIGGALLPQDDAEAVEWFTADALPELAFASTTAILEAWRQGL